jgi:hypothetical protein
MSLGSRFSPLERNPEYHPLWLQLVCIDNDLLGLNWRRSSLGCQKGE